MDTIADKLGISGSTFSSQQNKNSVTNPKYSDIYNEYLDDSIPKPDIMELKLADIWNRLIFVVRKVLMRFWTLWQNKSDMKQYWAVLTEDDHMLYFAIFLIIISFLLYIFF